MDDNTLEQRIKYLVEHGGVYDDPLADIRRGIRWAVGLGGLALVIALADLLV
jgi:hypothetical protein